MGTVYTLEDATKGTGAQNRAFHALLNAFFDWMVKIDTFQFEDNGRIFDFRAPSAGDFRDLFKSKYGAGFSHIEYVDDNLCMVRVKTLEEVPSNVIASFNYGHRGRIKGVLKSWGDYTKKERKDAIDRLFDVIKAVSCHDRRVSEIMEGMSGKS
ncbi:MAG: hypothetical protein PQJ60_10870 [Spirochaetales bacterium]|nr:hypothetical protein [Spirochaetales bacterium]